MINEYMTLEFVDGTKIPVIAIFGGPANVEGIVRDVLTIEIDPKTISFDVVENHFKNTNNLAHLYTYEPERNEDGNLYDVKIEIGEGYTIVLGVDKITRKVNPFPGKIVPETFETVYIVTIAQMTYDEWTSSEYYANNN